MKSARQEMILNIIGSRAVDTQEQLRELLAQRDIPVTQATLSRDMRELHIKKIPAENGGYRYAAAERLIPEMPQIFRESLVSVDHAANTVVLKCSTGMAQAVCAIFDRMGCHGAVGTLAGDDTIFVLMRTEADAAELAAEFSEII